MESMQTIAVLIPCHNEQATIAAVIDAFKRELPRATIYVFDNASTDDTAAIATEHGATVIYEPRLGKGYVVARMLECVHADFYVMVDGDDTYPAETVHELLAPVTAGLADMAVGSRRPDQTTDDSDGKKCFRNLHRLGNRLIGTLINRIFAVRLTDIFSGYRAFNNRLAERVPVVSSGFEVETELTVQTLHNRLSISEVPVAYRARPSGSHSKLRTFSDGFRVVWKLFNLVRAFKPLTFFGSLAIVLFVLSLWAGYAPIHDYITNPSHYVTHVPRAVLAAALMLLSAASAFLGLGLHAINWRFRELHNVMVRRNCRG